MSVKDEKAIRRHWHLVVFEVPQAGFVSKVSSYLWSKKRLISVPEINNMRTERQLPPNAVLVAINYMGMGTQYELTGTSADPVPSRTSELYMEGLRLGLHSSDPQGVVNPYPEEQPYERQEWQMGFAAGLLARNQTSQDNQVELA